MPHVTGKMGRTGAPQGSLIARRARDKAYSIGMMQGARELTRLAHVIRKLDPLDERYLPIAKELWNRCGFAQRMELDATVRDGEIITAEMRQEAVALAAKEIAKEQLEQEQHVSNGDSATAH